MRKIRKHTVGLLMPQKKKLKYFFRSVASGASASVEGNWMNCHFFPIFECNKGGELKPKLHDLTGQLRAYSLGFQGLTDEGLRIRVSRLFLPLMKTKLFSLE